MIIELLASYRGTHNLTLRSASKEITMFVAKCMQMRPFYDAIRLILALLIIISVQASSLLDANDGNESRNRSRSNTKKTKYAWYIGATGDEMILNQALVLVQSILLTKTIGDVVVTIFSDLSAQEDISATRKVKVSEYDIPLSLKRHPAVTFRVRTSPIQLDDIKSINYRKTVEKDDRLWSFMKIEAYTLVKYHTVVNLDADMIFMRNADELFLLPPGSHADGSVSIFNAGLFVIRPSLKDKSDLLDIVSSGSVSDCGGWENAWPGQRFHAHNYEQGLFYYYYYHIQKDKPKVLLDRSVYNMQVPSDYHESSVQSCGNETKDFMDDKKKNTLKSVWRPKIVHFTYCGKPRGGGDSKKDLSKAAGCAPFHEYWQEVFTRLFVKTETGRNRKPYFL